MIEAPQDKTITINYYYHFNISNGDFSEFMKVLSFPRTFHNTTQVNNYIYLNKKERSLIVQMMKKKLFLIKQQLMMKMN